MEKKLQDELNDLKTQMQTLNEFKTRVESKMSYELITSNVLNWESDSGDAYDYIHKTARTIRVEDSSVSALPFIIGSTKHTINGFNLYGTTGKDPVLRKRLNTIKNKLSRNEKCCIEGCTHISPKTNLPCKRTFALHLGIDDDPRFYILAIGLVFIPLAASLALLSSAITS